MHLHQIDACQQSFRQMHRHDEAVAAVIEQSADTVVDEALRIHDGVPAGVEVGGDIAGIATDEARDLQQGRRPQAWVPTHGCL